MEILILSIALAMDSMALSMASGARLCENLNLIRALKLSILFGFFQGIMPILGYFLGLTFVQIISEIDHFIACAILVFLGYKMIKESKENQYENKECIIDLPIKQVLMGAVATSIDALAVGITFSFNDINIWFACFIIFATCSILCLIGCYIGKYIGETLEEKALKLGGAILIILGIKIPIEHLGYL